MPSSVPCRRCKTNSLVKQAGCSAASAPPLSTWATCSADWNTSTRHAEALTAHGLGAAAVLLPRDSAICTRNLAEAQRAFEAALKLRTDNLPEFQGARILSTACTPGSRAVGGDIEAIKDMESTLANAGAVGDEYTVAFIAQALGEAYAAGRLRARGAVSEHRPGLLPSQRHAAYLARALQSLVYWYEQQDRGAEAEQARTEASRLVKNCPHHRFVHSTACPRHQRASAGHSAGTLKEAGTWTVLSAGC